MPLVRFEVRNEYALGVPELYKDAVQAEDPKAVLEGLNVAGLVGILRQLGDLAEFAAEVFHGLQEQVAATASRSRKLSARVQRIEASLPQLEKAILSQTSHIHFAYTPGTEWHPRIRNEQNHFIYDDMPHFVMDSYGECREPPRLQLLDRFDAGGPGSCLKRYSDPTFFKRASASSEAPNIEKSRSRKKARKSKRRRSWQRSGHLPNYTSSFSGRMPLSSTGQRHSPLSHSGSTVDTSFRSGKGEQSDSLCSKDGMDYIECVIHPSTSVLPSDTEARELSSGRGGRIPDSDEMIYRDEQAAFSGSYSPVRETIVAHSPSPTWDEKLEMLEPMDMEPRIDDLQDVPKMNFNLDQLDSQPINAESINQVDDLSEYESSPRSIFSEHDPKASIGDRPDVSKAGETVMRPNNVEKVNQADGLSEHQSSPLSDVDGQFEQTSLDRKFMELAGLNSEIDEMQDVLHEKFEPNYQSLEPSNMACLDQVPELSEGENTSESFAKGELSNGPADIASSRGEVQCMLDTHFDAAGQDTETRSTGHINQVDASCEDENTVTVIDWPQFDDESETDNFVDALNTIESESESDFEEQTKKAVGFFSASKDEVEGVTMNDQKAEITGDRKLEYKCPEPDDHMEDVTDDSQLSQALVPSTAIESLEHDEPSCNEPDAETLKVGDSACLVDGSRHSPTSLSSSTALSLEHAQSYCNELAVLQDQKLDNPACLFDDQFMQSERSLPDYVESVEHAQSSFNKSTAQGQKLDDSAYLIEDSQCSDASSSSATIISPEQPQSSCSELALVQGQKVVEPMSLLVDQSLEHTQSSFDELAAEEWKLDGSARLFNDSHCSTASVSSAAVASLAPAQSSSNETAVAEDKKLGDSSCLLDEQSMASNKPSSVDVESLQSFESSCNESAAQGQKLGHLQRSFDDTQCSNTSVASATLASHEHAQPFIFESAAEKGQKTDDSMSFSNEHLVKFPASSAPNDSEGIDFSDHKPAECEIGAMNSQAPPSEDADHTAHHLPQEIPVGFSSTTPLAFWTNGNLLGLGPSKPTVFGASSSVENAPMNSVRNTTVGQFNPNIVQKFNCSAGNQAPSLKDSECSDSTKEAKHNIANQDFGSFKYESHLLSNEKHGRSLDEDHINLTDHSLSQGVTNGHIIPHEAKAPRSAGVENASADTNDKSEDSSSLLSFLGRGLLKNGLRRTGSLGYDEKPKTDNPLSNNFENGCQDSVSHAAPVTNMKRESDSPVNSPPPSPPLEHMRISFRPIDSFESSRLKLKYPEGVDNHESTIDIFPSFQLVPEPSNLKQDIGSDSDDDTFCRSYACMSDDVLNQLSDSNSEDWESEDSSESNNHAVYGSFHRISSTHSASSSPHCEEATYGSIEDGSRSADPITLESGPSFGLPVLDTKDPFSYEEMKLSLNEVDSSHFQEQIPQTPPLPPVQWRASKSPLDAAEFNQDIKSGSLSKSFIPKLLGSSIPHTAKVESAGVPRSEDSSTNIKTEKLDDQKLDYQQLNFVAENGRKADESGGFLHQIRAKSLNLRQTGALDGQRNLRRLGTTRSGNPPSVANSTKVTAIIQKANAIRKAVASDDGEDDSWSDT